MKKAKTNKDRQADFRERMREAGFVQATVWVRVSHMPRLARYIERLKRENK